MSDEKFLSLPSEDDVFGKGKRLIAKSRTEYSILNEYFLTKE